MDKFLTGYKRKSNSTGNENSDVGTSSESKRNKEQEGSTAKKRKDTAAGKQFSKQPKAAAKTSRRYRRT